MGVNAAMATEALAPNAKANSLLMNDILIFDIQLVFALLGSGLALDTIDKLNQPHFHGHTNR